MFSLSCGRPLSDPDVLDRHLHVKLAMADAAARVLPPAKARGDELRAVGLAEDLADDLGPADEGRSHPGRASLVPGIEHLVEFDRAPGLEVLPIDLDRASRLHPELAPAVAYDSFHALIFPLIFPAARSSRSANHVLIGAEGRVRLDQDPLLELVLEVDEKPPPIVEQVVYHGGVRDDLASLPPPGGERRPDLPEDRYSRAPRGLHHAGSPAVLAGLVVRPLEARPDPLPRHLYDAEARDPRDPALRAIPLQGRAEGLLHRPAVRLDLHVDEVIDDDSPQVPQPELA